MASQLLTKLAEGPVVVAEGYLFELERRGYLQAGAYVPEVVLEHPEKVQQLHEEFAHAGSDVVLAFTYYGHREKLRVIGKEHLLEPMNRQALEIAKGVADETGTILAGNICNTNLWVTDDDENVPTIREIFTEQVTWAAEAGVDYIVGETYAFFGEARLANQVIREHGFDSVITLSTDAHNRLACGTDIVEAARILEQEGASVVGLNCHTGPASMLPLVTRIREAVAIPVAALPVTYRTTLEHPTFQSLEDPVAAVTTPNGRAFPTALDPFTCSRYDIAEFGAAMAALDVRYVGLCCGAAPHHVRALAESLGRTPAASRYSANMQLHALFGDYDGIKETNQQRARTM